MIALAEALHRLRRRLILVGILGLLSLSVVWAHSGMSMDHMSTQQAVAMCLAVTGAVAVVAIASMANGPTWPKVSASTSGRTAVFEPETRAVPARAGPSALQVFLR
jgi:hypothetical protein